MTRVREAWTFSSSLHPREPNRITSSWVTQINNQVALCLRKMRQMIAITYSLRTTNRPRTSKLTISSSSSSILSKTKHRQGRRPLRRDNQLISPWASEVTLLRLAFLPADLIKCLTLACSARVPTTIALNLHKGLFQMQISLQVVVTMTTLRTTAACNLKTLALRSMTHKWARGHHPTSSWEIQMATLRIIALKVLQMALSPLHSTIRAKTVVVLLGQ